MLIHLLASGSKGNCCIVKCDNTKIVIDCGCTKKYLVNSFNEVNISVDDVDALLVTHSHIDHIQQIKMFKNTNIYSSVYLDSNNVTILAPFEEIKVNDVTITSIPLSHDSGITMGYVIEYNKQKLVYITDTGYIPNKIKDIISDADYYIFEFNHDVEMLMQTNRPMYIKQRIVNDYGHLCNEDAALVLSEIISNKTKDIVLAHISQEANNEEKARNALIKYMSEELLKSVNIQAGKQDKIITIEKIGKNND